MNDFIKLTEVTSHDTLSDIYVNMYDIAYITPATGEEWTTVIGIYSRQFGVKETLSEVLEKLEYAYGGTSRE